MKTICFADEDVSVYIFDDATYVSIQADKTVVGKPTELIIGDCNYYNSNLYKNVIAPEDWQGWKYLYTELDGWTLNPDWVDPTPPVTE